MMPCSCRDWGSLQAARSFALSGPGPETYARVRVPVLVLTGADDKVVPAASSRSVAALFRKRGAGEFWNLCWVGDRGCTRDAWRGCFTPWRRGKLVFFSWTCILVSCGPHGKVANEHVCMCMLMGPVGCTAMPSEASSHSDRACMFCVLPLPLACKCTQ